MLEDGSIDLVVTSPPYPMIEMWDRCFIGMNREIGTALEGGDGRRAFELMHLELDAVWTEATRVVKEGGYICINIGDATRKIGNDFRLYPNHARISSSLFSQGLDSLPAILWRKQTNAPNKFMGSGMLPPGAYTTLEHEYILLVRKGEKRVFPKNSDKQNRRESAYFWEERNNWFSDVWFDLKGTTQRIKKDALRLRSGAYPFELPYRLISMFSIKGDTVLDPFLGLGTTTFASMACCRNSIGLEIDEGFKDAIYSRMDQIAFESNQRIRERMHSHRDFIQARFEQKGPFRYGNRPYGFPVVTRQETDLLLNQVLTVGKAENEEFHVDYSDDPQKEFCRDWSEMIQEGKKTSAPKAGKSKKKSKQVQIKSA